MPVTNASPAFQSRVAPCTEVGHASWGMLGDIAGSGLEGPDERDTESLNRAQFWRSRKNFIFLFMSVLKGKASPGSSG
jgi:hypothetical protein